MNRQYRDDLNCKLFDAVPELKSVADAELDYWGDEEPNSHVVYGDVLASYMKSTDAEEDADVLRRIFDLLETLAHQPRGSTARSVLMTEVLHAIMSPNEDEELEEVFEWLAVVRKRYMGEKTLRLARVKASSFGYKYTQDCLEALGGGPSDMKEQTS